MNNSLKIKQFSFEALWERIEEIYGFVPEVIKQILFVNGFDSYLALKGIRFEDKNEFFGLLENTITENVTSECDSEEKANLINSLAGYNYSTMNFRIKPGHRNLIMNLMREIDHTDVNDFFKTKQQEVVQITSEDFIVKSPSQIKFEVQDQDEDQSIEEEQFVCDTNDYNQTIQTVENDEEVVFEERSEHFILEEYLSDENNTLEELESDGYFMSGRYGKKGNRRPSRMYNEEFLAQKINPRRRRVTTVKAYPNTDEGTTERFRDLMKQSMECILSKELFLSISDKPVDVQKETDSRWNVACPLCPARIRLAVNFENNGKYCNYKRSNFERHLRFKHCKQLTKKQTEIAFIYQN